MPRKNPSVFQHSKSHAQSALTNSSSSWTSPASWFPSPLLALLKFHVFHVSSFVSRAPRRFGEIRGSKRGGSTSVRGDSGEVGGPLRYRFGVGFLTRKKLPIKHKYRPHQHLNFLPTISRSPNTIFARISTPKTGLYSAFCTLKSTFSPHVVWWSVSSRLLVGHRSVDGRLVVGWWSVTGRLVVGYRSVGGRLVVALHTKATSPKTSQPMFVEPLAKTSTPATGIQHDLCANVRHKIPLANGHFPPLRRFVPLGLGGSTPSRATTPTELLTHEQA